MYDAARQDADAGQQAIVRAALTGGERTLSDAPAIAPPESALQKLEQLILTDDEHAAAVLRKWMQA